VATIDPMTIEAGPVLRGLAFKGVDAAARGCDRARGISEPRDDPHDRDDAGCDPEVALVDGGLQNQNNSAGGYAGRGRPPEEPGEGTMLLRSVIIVSHAHRVPSRSATRLPAVRRNGHRNATIATTAPTTGSTRPTGVVRTLGPRVALYATVRARRRRLLSRALRALLSNGFLYSQPG
jgi:hypothetical protein